MKNNIQLDRLDIKILHELQLDASLSNQELAEKVSLTAAPCSRRVKQLQDLGVITSHSIQIDAKAVSLNIFALLYISMDKHIPERFENFEKTISEIPEIIECYMVTGNNADYQLKVAVPDMDNYYKVLLGKITRIEGVSGVHSSFILRKVIEGRGLPLNYVTN